MLVPKVNGKVYSGRGPGTNGGGGRESAGVGVDGGAEGCADCGGGKVCGIGVLFSGAESGGGVPVGMEGEIVEEEAGGGDAGW